MFALESAANVFMLAAVFLAARNHRMNWVCGIIGCALFAALFIHTRLYANVTLQVFFIITNLIGLWNWCRPAGENPELPITKVSLGTIMFVFLPLALLTTFAYGTLLAKMTDAHLPRIDSLMLTFSIIAQFLLMGRKRETWLFWIVVNLIGIPLFISQGLYLTGFVYGLFLLNAVYGYFNWRQEMQAQP